MCPNANLQVLLWLWIGAIGKAQFQVSHKQCDSNGDIIECHGKLPTFIPADVTAVIVYEFNFDSDFDFNDSGWLNVTKLSFNPGQSVLKTWGNTSVELGSSIFERLENLEYLQIACRCLSQISHDTFYGLNKLKTLDLSNNRLTRESFVQVIKGDKILPSVEELVYSNTSVLDFGTFIIDEDFLNAVRNKHLKVLDLSRTKVIFSKERALFQSLTSLEKLNISESGSAVATLFQALYENRLIFPGFPNLKSLDLSFPSEFDQIIRPGESTYFLPVSKELKDFRFRKFLSQSLKVLYGEQIPVPFLKQDEILCLKLDFPDIQSSFLNCIVGKLNIEKLVLNENLINDFDINVWRYVSELRHLDLAKNRLGHTFAQKEYIRTMLKSLKALEVFVISGNAIQTLPENAFENAGMLQVLDLSQNDLKSVIFSTDKLTSLQHLDLRHNKIAFLDDASLKRFDSLKLQTNVTPSENVSTRIDLDGNPFSCSCVNRHYFNWTIFNNEKSSCLLDGDRQNIDFYMLKHSYYLCKVTLFIIVYTLLAMAELVATVVLVRFISHERKDAELRSKIKYGIRQYKENRENNRKHPVFLSFCSEDDEIVMDEIVPKLEDGLRKLLDTDLRCVATGYNDFRPGMSLANEIIRCVEESSVVIFFVTNAFCRKLWCRNETLIAYYENKPTILMIWEELDLKLMPKYLYHHYQHHTRVHWITENGQRVMKPDWDKLCESVVSLFVD